MPARRSSSRKGRARTAGGRGSRTTPTTRRAQLLLLGALVVSTVVLVAWFPAASLLHQRASLAADEAQLSTLHKQDAALAQEKKNLNDAGEIGRIAREQYQLVSPGQQAYEVLPPTGAASPGTPYAGDPGSAGPEAPSATPELPPGGVTTTTAGAPASTHSATKGRAAGGGLLSRMVDTLEFWR